MATHRWGVVADLAADQHGVISRRQAAAEGFGPAHIRAMVDRGQLEEPIRGVLRDTFAPRTWCQSVMAACLATGGVASGATAAALHRLEGFEPVELIEVTVPRGGRRSLPGVTVRSATTLQPRDVTRADGIPTTSLALTLCEIGRVTTLDGVERALDDALRRGVSDRWIRETLARVDRPGPTGTGRLRQVLALSDRQGVVPDSFRERVTERILQHPELEPLRRQFEIRGAGGEFIARPDLAVVRVKLGIEFHSDQWHYGPRRGRGDRRRDLAAAEVDWELIYLDAADHRTPDDALRSVLRIVRSRARTVQIG